MPGYDPALPRSFINNPTLAAALQRLKAQYGKAQFPADANGSTVNEIQRATPEETPEPGALVVLPKWQPALGAAV